MTRGKKLRKIAWFTQWLELDGNGQPVAPGDDLARNIRKFFSEHPSRDVTFELTTCMPPLTAVNSPRGVRCDYVALYVPADS